MGDCRVRISLVGIFWKENSWVSLDRRKGQTGSCWAISIGHSVQARERWIDGIVPYAGPGAQIEDSRRLFIDSHSPLALGSQQPSLHLDVVVTFWRKAFHDVWFSHWSVAIFCLPVRRCGTSYRCGTLIYGYCPSWNTQLSAWMSTDGEKSRDLGVRSRWSTMEPIPEMKLTRELISCTS